MSEHETPGPRSGASEHGPNTVCFSCGGFRKISEPRVYVIQATAEMQTGMSMGEWRPCPQCSASGQLSGLRPPA